MKKAPLLIAALVGVLIGFFIGINVPDQQKTNTTPSAQNTNKVDPGTTTLPDKVIAENTSPAKPASETVITEEKTEETVVVEVPIEDSTDTPPEEPVRQPTVDPLPTTPSRPIVSNAELKPIPLGISDTKISTTLRSIAENMEAQKLEYIVSKGQDCSGIFHKIKDSLQVRLPALSQNDSYQYPSFATVRSSRQIADWYWKNKNLLIVEDAMASRNSIRPGSVMFFGKPDKKFKDMTIEMLTDKDNNYTSNGIIMHIGVVTSVRTDEDGNVVDYTIMHGRNKRIHASRSGSKAVQSKRKKNLPPFGNWSQQWVAVANIVTPKL